MAFFLCFLILSKAQAWAKMRIKMQRRVPILSKQNPDVGINMEEMIWLKPLQSIL